MKRLDHYWYSQNPVAWLLLPLSWLFCLVAMLRRMLYVNRVIPSYSVKAPVIIVGNITVGGTGKTPLLISLCEYLNQNGYKPGVVSRGYGADIDSERLLTSDDDAASCGDEPVLIHQRTGCPVVIGRDRVAAAEKLLEESDCDVILSDDGLQHYRLRRKLEIAVVDLQRQFGNGFCLPAGPLREPVARLNRVDMVVHHGKCEQAYQFTLRIDEAVNLQTGEQRKMATFADGPVHAVAGIGHPRRFFTQLREFGLTVCEHAFVDHHVYEASDVEFGDNAPVLVTEKDAVKLRRFCAPAEPGGRPGNIWVVPVTAEMSERLGGDLINMLRQNG